MRATSASALVLAPGGDVLLEQAEEAQHRDERAAQVVRHGVGEALELGVAPLHLADRLLQAGRHVVERLGDDLQLVARLDPQPLLVVPARHLLHALGERAERPREARAERQAQRADDHAGAGHQPDRQPDRGRELPLQAGEADVIDHRQPVAPPVLDVGHHDLDRAAPGALGADLARLDAPHGGQALRAEQDARLVGRRDERARVEQHAALDVADLDRGDLLGAREQVEHGLPELEVARLEVAVEALAERGRRQHRELARARLEPEPDRAPRRDQQVGGVRDLDQHQRRDEGRHESRAQAVDDRGHGRLAPSAGRRSRGRSARLTGGSQLTRVRS